MTGKDINRLIKILPLSSALIGAPRRTTEMLTLAELYPDKLSIHVFETIDESIRKSISVQNNMDEKKHTLFLAILKDGRVWGRNGAVIGYNDFFITDVSREFKANLKVDHSIYYTVKQKRQTDLHGEVAVIGTAGANIYYHWMLDVLPRIGLLSRRIKISDIRYFITEYTELVFQKESLKKLGIEHHKIIASNDNWNFHVKADKLWVPSLAGLLDIPNEFQILFLRELFKSDISTQQPFRKIYISRKYTGRRFIINEDQLFNYLSQFNFEKVYCEQLSISQQALLFSEAAIIVSSHGSALTNIVFCQPGSFILDIFNASHVNFCFWYISDILNLNYHYVTGESIPIDENIKNDNTYIDLDVVKKKLIGVV